MNNGIAHIKNYKEYNMQIDNRKIGQEHPPFIIAEVSGNHNGSLDYALAIIDAIADSGADAVKLQTYTADTLTIDAPQDDFHITDPNSLWHGRSLYELYEEAHTPWEWHEALFKRAREHGLIVFSTPFDETAVDFLETLDVPCYKIASFENGDIPLIRAVAKTGKPMIISCGMASVDVIEEAVSTARNEGVKDIVLLKCTSAYPADPKDINLATLADMRNKFGVEVGLSDHTMGIAVPVAATALGATVIEKHVTLRREDGGVDAAFSLEPDELKQLVESTHIAWQATGKVTYGSASATEEKSGQFRRSIYITQDIKAGEAFTLDNIRCIRPGFGLEPRLFDAVLGKKAASDIIRGTALSETHITEVLE